MARYRLKSEFAVEGANDREVFERLQAFLASAEYGAGPVEFLGVDGKSLEAVPDQTPAGQSRLF